MNTKIPPEDEEQLEAEIRAYLETRGEEGATVEEIRAHVEAKRRRDTIHAVT